LPTRQAVQIRWTDNSKQHRELRRMTGLRFFETTGCAFIRLRSLIPPVKTGGYFY